MYSIANICNVDYFNMNIVSTYIIVLMLCVCVFFNSKLRAKLGLKPLDLNETKKGEVNIASPHLN